MLVEDFKPASSDPLAEMEASVGLKATPSVERQIEHHKRAFVAGDIDADELGYRVERLLRGERAQTDYVVLPGRPRTAMAGMPVAERLEQTMVPRRAWESLVARYGEDGAVRFVWAKGWPPS